MCGERYDIDDDKLGSFYISDNISKVVCQTCGDTQRYGCLPWWISYLGKFEGYSVHGHFVRAGHSMQEANGVIAKHRKQHGFSEWKFPGDGPEAA